MKVFSLLTGAAAAAIVQNASGLPVREAPTAVGNVANSDDMPSGSNQALQASGLAEDSEFLQSLFLQKQDTGVQEANWTQDAERYVRSLMKELASHLTPSHRREAWLATRSRTESAILKVAGWNGHDSVVLSQAEKDLLDKHYNLIKKITLEEFGNALTEAHAVVQKFDPYIVCENLLSSDKITMRAIYTNKAGHQMETTVTCDGDDFKIVKIPKGAKDLKVHESINDGPYREIFRAPSGDYRSTKGWRSSSPSSVLEFAEEKLSDLDKLIEAGDTQAVKDYATDLIKVFGKRDRTGVYRAALSAKAAAMQAEDELSTAQKWFDITEAAKQRAKAARARQRASEL